MYILISPTVVWGNHFGDKGLIFYFIQYKMIKLIQITTFFLCIFCIIVSCISFLLLFFSLGIWQTHERLNRNITKITGKQGIFQSFSTTHTHFKSGIRYLCDKSNVYHWYIWRSCRLILNHTFYNFHLNSKYPKYFSDKEEVG